MRRQQSKETKETAAVQPPPVQHIDPPPTAGSGSRSVTVHIYARQQLTTTDVAAGEIVRLIGELQVAVEAAGGDRRSITITQENNT